MSAVSVNVGGYWRTSVSITEAATWDELKQLIWERTGVPDWRQRLTPNGEADEAVGAVDEVMCEWGELASGQHPLHVAGGSNTPRTVYSIQYCNSYTQVGLSPQEPAPTLSPPLYNTARTG